MEDLPVYRATLWPTDTAEGGTVAGGWSMTLTPPTHTYVQPQGGPALATTHWVSLLPSGLPVDTLLFSPPPKPTPPQILTRVRNASSRRGRGRDLSSITSAPGTKTEE